MYKTPRILFLCPSNLSPTGGVQKIYEFAQALADAGFASFVVHRNSRYRPNWFESDVPVLGRNDVVVEPCDLLVIPEFMGTIIPQLEGCAKVVLNQNSYIVFDENFHNKEVVSILVVSDYIRRYSEFAYPRKTILPIHMGYDETIFNAVNCRKKKQIAYMPRRRSIDSKRLLQALDARGALSGWTLAPIDGLNARQVADVMRESMIFLSFSQREGFGLPPLEAMACGCLVVGFHGHGGAEFFDPAYCYPIPEDDMCEFQEILESILVSADAENICELNGRKAAQAIASRYYLQRQSSDVVDAFSKAQIGAQSLQGLRPVSLKGISFETSKIRLCLRHLKNAIKVIFQ